MSTSLELTDGGRLLLSHNNCYLKISNAGVVPRGVYKIVADIHKADLEECIQRMRSENLYIVELVDRSLLAIEREDIPRLRDIATDSPDRFADAHHSERDMI